MNQEHEAQMLMFRHDRKMLARMLVSAQMRIKELENQIESIVHPDPEDCDHSHVSWHSTDAWCTDCGSQV